MHAASVHPEPGSNSLKNLYQTPKLLLKRSTRFSELMFFLSFFYFLSNKLLCFNEIPSHVLFVFEISVVQFSMTDVARFRSATFLSYHTFSLLSTPFLNFFQSFLKFSKFFPAVSALPVCFFRVSLSIIASHSPFVKWFFWIFSGFFHFWWIFIVPWFFSILFLHFQQKEIVLTPAMVFISAKHWLFSDSYV